MSLNDDKASTFFFVDITKSAMIICHTVTICLSYTYYSRATIAVHRSTAAMSPSSDQSEQLRRQIHRLPAWPRGIPTARAGCRYSPPAFRTEETRAPCDRQTAKSGGPKETSAFGGAAKRAVPVGTLCPIAVDCANASAADGAVRRTHCDQRGISRQCRRQHKLDRTL